MALSPTLLMPTMSLQVQPHGQSRILGELTPWKMVCCCFCSIIGLTRFFTLQLILMLVHLFYYQALTVILFNFEQTHNFPSCHCQTPWYRSEGPMGLPRWPLLPSPHPTLLEMQHFTSISRGMKGSRDDYELVDGDDDYEELSEPEDVQDD